jgi:hypothetical protein
MIREPVGPVVSPAMYGGHALSGCEKQTTRAIRGARQKAP